MLFVGKSTNINHFYGHFNCYVTVITRPGTTKLGCSTYFDGHHMATGCLGHKCLSCTFRVLTRKRPEWTKKWPQQNHPGSAYIGEDVLLEFVSSAITTGWWFGTCFIFPSIGNVIIPADELIFFRGVGLNHQPVMVKYPQIYGQHRGN